MMVTNDGLLSGHKSGNNCHSWNNCKPYRATGAAFVVVTRSKRKYDERSRAPWRNWYKLKSWFNLRDRQLGRQPLCERHKERGKYVAATVVHHKVPHRGDRALFIDPDNLESLCKACHDGEAQQQEKRGFSSRVGPDGWPTDDGHPLYTKP